MTLPTPVPDDLDPNGIEPFDHVIVGTGQALGTLLAGLPDDARVAVVEGSDVGGSCVNSGCTPTKTLVASAKVAHQVRRAMDYGVRTGPVAIDFAAVRARMNELRHASRDGLEGWLEGADHVTLVRGWARFVAPRTLRVGDRTLRGERVYLNVGTRARVPDVPGLSEVDWLDNVGILDLADVPEHLLVLGAGYVGLEFAQVFARFGARVTVITTGAQILSREDTDVAAAVQEILAAEGVRFRLRSRVTRVEPTEQGGVTVEFGGPEGEARVTGSHLLVATGRAPNADLLDLERAGVTTDERGFIPVDDQLRTSADGVYALGDVNGRGAFTHTSVNDAEIVLDGLHGGPRRLSHRDTVHALFIDPPLGRVGLSEREAVAGGYRLLRAVRPMRRFARAKEMGETAGFVKLLVDAETERFVGASVLGVGGDEVVAVIATAMNAGITLGEFRTTVLPHPTVAELLPWMLDELEPLEAQAN